MAYTFPWNQVNTLVQSYIAPTLQDQVFKSNAYLNRAKGRIKFFTGGRDIVQPQVWKAQDGGWFAGMDVLDTTETDDIQAATFRAKNAYVPLVISWEEQQKVQGDQMVKSLMEAKSEIAKNSAYRLINTNLYNAGTEIKALTGLQYSLRDFTGAAPGVLPAQTYAGIPRQGRYDGSGGGTQTNNWWIHYGDNTAYVTTAGGNFDPKTAGNVHEVLGRAWANIRIQSHKSPTLMLSNYGTWTAYKNALSMNDRYQRPEMDNKTAEAGYDSLMFHKAVWIADEDAPRDASKIEKLYFLNEEAVRLYVASGVNFAFEPFRKPPNQMGQVGYILFRGEVCVVEPRACGVLSSIDTSAVS